jgi:hypothetical protein
MSNLDALIQDLVIANRILLTRPDGGHAHPPKGCSANA